MSISPASNTSAMTAGKTAKPTHPTFLLPRPDPIARLRLMLTVFRRHKVLAVLACLFGVGLSVLIYRAWGPYRTYRVAVAVASPSQSSAPLLVGAARRDITPNLDDYDPWIDADGNGKFEPKKGDTYTDRNGNGRFDFVWLGGFDSNRPAQGINDPLGVRAIAFRRDSITIVLVTIDSVGLTHERFIKIRKSIDHPAEGITHIVFSTTHTHNAPDTMGIWSHHPLFSRFDEGYLDFVLDQTRAAVLEAVGALQPARARYAVSEVPAEGFVRDSRPPKVFDRQLGAVCFTRADSDETIAVLVSWGNHPEALGGSNPLISSDFVHYWREGVERGLPEPNGVPGLGGTCLFFQGPLGGLMTPLGLAVPDRDGRRVHSENGPAKAKALGENLARLTVESLDKDRALPMEESRLGVVARSIFAPIEGTFKIPILLGLIHPGWFWGKARSEIDAVRIGDIEIVTVPGEVYPEIIDGGVECPDGADYPGPLIEVPPLRSAMRGQVNLVFNLANDEIGYILPRTQWDTEPPFTYGREKPLYGEVNSGGPDLAGVVHGEALVALRQLHDLLSESGVVSDED